MLFKKKRQLVPEKMIGDLAPVSLREGLSSDKLTILWKKKKKIFKIMYQNPDFLQLIILYTQHINKTQST